MTASKKHFTYHQATLHYRVAGNGTNALLLFHGFGQDHSVFDALVADLPGHTLYAFDLFFHGESEWGYDEQPLEKSFWNDLLLQFLKENRIEKFSVLGFSIGCRFALIAVEAMPLRIDGIFLLAPDGIQKNMWYSLATASKISRTIFKRLITKPQLFFSLAKILGKIRLLNGRLITFAVHQMSSPEKRKQVYYSWIVFRRLQPNIKKTATLINTNHLALYFLIGKNDPVITVSTLNRLAYRLKKYHLEIASTTHAGLLRRELIISLIQRHYKPQ